MILKWWELGRFFDIPLSVYLLLFCLFVCGITIFFSISCILGAENRGVVWNNKVGI